MNWGCLGVGVELNSYDISVGGPMSLVSLLREEGAESHLMFQALHEVIRLWQFETDAVMFVHGNVAGQSNQLKNITIMFGCLDTANCSSSMP